MIPEKRRCSITVHAHPKATVEAEEWILELFKSGYPKTKIAKFLGLSLSQVTKYIDNCVWTINPNAKRGDEYAPFLSPENSILQKKEFLQEDMDYIIDFLQSQKPNLKTYCVYKLVTPDDSLSYIGQTKDLPEIRWQHEISQGVSCPNYHTKKFIQTGALDHFNEWNRYIYQANGWVRFSQDMMFQDTNIWSEDEAGWLESYLISYHNTKDKGLNDNIPHPLNAVFPKEFISNPKELIEYLRLEGIKNNRWCVFMMISPEGSWGYVSKTNLPLKKRIDQGINNVKMDRMKDRIKSYRDIANWHIYILTKEGWCCWLPQTESNKGSIWKSEEANWLESYFISKYNLCEEGMNSCAPFIPNAAYPQLTNIDARTLKKHPYYPEVANNKLRAQKT